MHEESQAHGKDNPIRDPALVSGLHSAIERKQKERVVRETERFYEQLVGEAGAAIVVLDRAGTILTWNTGAERMFGWTTEEAIGRSYLTLQGDDVRPHVTENLRRLFAGARLINHEIRRRRKDGTWFDALLTATPVRNAQGQGTAAQSIIKDITERKQAEEALQESERHLREALEELKATQQQVLQQERLRALGQMASGIAHDFNNALSPLMGFSELLLDRPEFLDNKEKVMRYLEAINTAAKDAAAVVRRLRGVYRLRGQEEAVAPG